MNQSEAIRDAFNDATDAKVCIEVGSDGLSVLRGLLSENDGLHGFQRVFTSNGIHHVEVFANQKNRTAAFAAIMKCFDADKSCRLVGVSVEA